MRTAPNSPLIAIFPDFTVTVPPMPNKRAITPITRASQAAGVCMNLSRLFDIWPLP